MKMAADQVKEKFGFDPQTVGIRYRGFWIIEDLDEQDAAIGAEVGDLVVSARDGGGNYEDPEASELPGYFGSMEDWGDSTYLYYFFRAPENQ